MPGHFLVYVFKHRARVRMRAFAQGAVALRFRIGSAHRLIELSGQRVVTLHAPLAQADQMGLQPLYRIAQRPVLPLVTRAIAARVIARRMWRDAIGEELDECRPMIGASAISGPARNGVDRKQIIAVDTEPRDSEADRP